jgi:catechol 2,3-dioxygenase-like lactoylglutathione lyase family enzyme
MNSAIEERETNTVAAAAAPQSVVALLHVADVQRSIAFYQQLGFELGNQPQKNAEGLTTFAWMKTQHGKAAQIMLTLTGRPLNPGAQDVIFYLYVDNMPAYRAQLIERGIKVGEVQHPFWNRTGEFRVDDPDGWTWQVC